MASADLFTPRLRNQLHGYTSIIAGDVESMSGVAYLELARPQRHNAFHEDLWAEFPRALRELDARATTRVIVLAGQGPNFCAGIDVGYLQRNFAGMMGQEPAAPAVGAGSCPGAQRAAMRRGILALQDAYSQLERCTSPVVAAVHGRCIGGGVDLVTACDLRLCSEDATFCVKEVDLAIAADLGTLQRLPHLVGHGVAMDLALTARSVGAAEAHRIGLVTAVAEAASPSASASAAPPAQRLAGQAGCSNSSNSSSAGRSGGDAMGRSGRGDVVAAALRLAAAIASKPQLAVQGTKRVLLHARDQPRVSDGLDYVATWNSAQLLTRDLEQLVGGGGRGGGRAGGSRAGAGAGTGSGGAAAAGGGPQASAAPLPPRSRL